MVQAMRVAPTWAAGSYGLPSRQAPQDADLGAGKDAQGVGVLTATIPGATVDGTRPRPRRSLYGRPGRRPVGTAQGTPVRMRNSVKAS